MNSIIIDKADGVLIIHIKPLGIEVPPKAVILNYSGEIIEKLELMQGTNTVVLNPYHSKNYSIRITNGKNVITQKI